MASVNDWAAKAARRVAEEYCEADQPGNVSIDRIAAIIETFAEPMRKLLIESRREHSRGYHDEACDYPPCPVSEEDHTLMAPSEEDECTCGATKWNKKIDEALNGR